MFVHVRRTAGIKIPILEILDARESSRPAADATAGGDIGKAIRRRSHLPDGIQRKPDEIFGSNFFMIIQFIPTARARARCIGAPYRDTCRTYPAIPMARLLFCKWPDVIRAPYYCSVLPGKKNPPFRVHSASERASGSRSTPARERSLKIDRSTPAAEFHARDTPPYRARRCLFSDTRQ